MSYWTRRALEQLYLYAKPEQEPKIGLVFSPEFYCEAYKLFDVKVIALLINQIYRYFGASMSKSG